MGKSSGNSETLDAARKLIEVFGCLRKEVIAQGGREQDVFRICGDRKLSQDLATRILGKQTANADGMVFTGPFRIFMDYDIPFSQRIAAACFDWVNPGFEKCTFPSAGRGRSAHVLGFVSFPDYMDTVRVLKAIESANGPRPATPEVLLAFSEANPDVQRSCRIVAIGTEMDVNGEKLFPGLWGSTSGRTLQLHRVSDDWPPKTRFLIIEKPKGAGT